MDEFSTEDEQLEELKRWWGENGKFVIAGLVVGIGLLVGWRAWQSYRIERAESGSNAYSEMISALGANDRELALQIGERVMDEYVDTPYADQAALALARFHMEQIEPEEAAELLQRVVDQSRDAELRDISRLRLARIRLDQERFDAALAMLDEVTVDTVQPRVHEIRGDVYLARGDLELARTEYAAAMVFTELSIVDRNLLQMKLDDLAVPDPGADAAADEDAGDEQTTETGEDTASDS